MSKRSNAEDTDRDARLAKRAREFDLSAENDVLKKRVKLLEDENVELKDENVELKDENVELKNEIDHLKTGLKLREDLNEKIHAELDGLKHCTDPDAVKNFLSGPLTDLLADDIFKSLLDSGHIVADPMKNPPHLAQYSNEDFIKSLGESRFVELLSDVMKRAHELKAVTATDTSSSSSGSSGSGTATATATEISAEEATARGHIEQWLASAMASILQGISPEFKWDLAVLYALEIQKRTQCATLIDLAPVPGGFSADSIRTKKNLFVDKVMSKIKGQTKLIQRGLDGFVGEDNAAKTYKIATTRTSAGRVKVASIITAMFLSYMGEPQADKGSGPSSSSSLPTECTSTDAAMLDGYDFRGGMMTQRRHSPLNDKSLQEVWDEYGMTMWTQNEEEKALWESQERGYLTSRLRFVNDAVSQGSIVLKPLGGTGAAATDDAVGVEAAGKKRKRSPTEQKVCPVCDVKMGITKVVSRPVSS